YVLTIYYVTSIYVFFFQAEDGIRDATVTGVQTCALPISYTNWNRPQTYSITRVDEDGHSKVLENNALVPPVNIGPRSTPFYDDRSEERRVGKECRLWWSPGT